MDEELSLAKILSTGRRIGKFIPCSAGMLPMAAKPQSWHEKVHIQ